MQRLEQEQVNANELADYIETGGENIDRKELATMLRQQQVEIEALKNRNWDLVSEPWGFDRQPAKEYKPNQTLECAFDLAGFKPPAKTLTDEEIDAVGDEVSNLIDTYAGRREFARAILRKAQEK